MSDSGEGSSGGNSSSAATSTSSDSTSAADTDGTTSGGSSESGDSSGTGGSPGTHEPAGFMVLFDEDWDNFTDNDWGVKEPDNGSDPASNAETSNGELVFNYPAGFQGGTEPARVVVGGLYFGPQQYRRDEGVVLSENWQGHQSGVNKLWYFYNYQGATTTYLEARGPDAEPLHLGITTQKEIGLGNQDVIDWDDPRNIASPSETDAEIVRGVPFTIEAFCDPGTPGQHDGVIKVWKDGVLIIHVDDMAILDTDDTKGFYGVGWAPVWGGTNDNTSDAQTIRVDHTYVSYGGT